MIKKIILSLLILSFIPSDAQEKKTNESNKFLISIHYTGNIRNDNFIGDNYNGILGFDASYNLLNDKLFSIQGGLSLDFFNSRQNPYNLKVINTLQINPNIGIEFKSNKSFRPFFNLGYSFFAAKYQIQQTFLNNINAQDPAFQTISGEVKNNFNSISINPGFRIYFKQKFYAQADYKYLPIKSNINAHIISLGFGINF